MQLQFPSQKLLIMQSMGHWKKQTPSKLFEELLILMMTMNQLLRMFQQQQTTQTGFVEFWGLPPLVPLLQCVNWLGFEICSVNRMNSRTRKLGYVNLNWPKCSAWVTESLALTDGSFCQKQNTLYFRLCKNCEFMMCILIVDHQFNCMHPWCSWECMLPGRCSPGKRCHTFWNRNIVLLPILLGKVSCVPKTTLCELYGVMFWE